MFCHVTSRAILFAYVPKKGHEAYMSLPTGLICGCLPWFNEVYQHLYILFHFAEQTGFLPMRKQRRRSASQ